MRLQFWGAVRTVTGSMHLLETAGGRVLLDCGMFQGRRAEANERNRNFPFDPASVDAIVLSHAHIDHCGAIPSFVKRGFTGRVYTTHPTADLCEYLLRDSGHVQQMDADHINRNLKQGEPKVEPIYTEADALEALTHFASTNYGGSVTPIPNLKVTFQEAGHILGSASLLVEATDNGHATRLGFTGDLGRKNFPILRDPVPLAGIDSLIMESTYGDRNHGPTADVDGILLGHLQRVFRRGGKCVIPAFALGRTQGVVYALNGMYDAGKLPPVPIYVDTPLGVNVTEVFRKHAEVMDKAARAIIQQEGDAFGFPRLQYIKDVEDSKKLNEMPGPFVVISASGMCEGGRILHHLKHAVGDPRNLILLTGFQAEHTLGRRLQEGAKVVRIYGQEYHVMAEVQKIDGLSCHADQGELTGYAAGAARNAKVFLVHGEMPAAEALQAKLRGAGVKDVTIPDRGQKFEL